MMSGIRKLVMILVGVALAVPAAGLEAPLVYERYPEERDEFRPYGGTGFQANFKAPDGEWKLPELLSAKPIYQLIDLGDRKHLIVLDQQRAKDAFYNRLYFDANANRDLTDDPVVETTASDNGSYYHVSFPPIDATVVVDGKLLPYSFMPMAYGSFEGSVVSRLTRLFTGGQREWRYLQVSLNVHCLYASAFEFDGQSYRLWLGDANANGRFDDRLDIPDESRGSSRIYAQGDHLYLKADADVDYNDRQTLGDLLWLNGTLFETGIDIAEGTLTLTPRTEGLAQLELENPPDQLSLYTNDEKHCIMLFRPTPTVAVPPGDYRLLSYKVVRNDDQSDRWRLCATGTTDGPVITVEKAGTAVLKLGEPYQALARVADWDMERVQTGQRDVRLNFTIEGAAKEQVTELSRVAGEKSTLPMSTRDARRPKEPTYKILLPDGEVVAQGSFEYG